MTAKTQTVTQAQLDACLRCIDELTGEVFYRVNSATHVDVTYTVRSHKEFHVLSCTCPSMNPAVDEYGFFKYAPRVCWHCKASVAHSRQYSALKQAEREAATRLAHLVEMGLTEAEAKVALSHSLTVDGVPASDEEL